MLDRIRRGKAKSNFHPLVASWWLLLLVCCMMWSHVCCSSCVYMAWHCCGIVLAVCSYVSMSSHGMLSSVVSDGSCILMSWFVGVSGLCASLGLCCCCGCCCCSVGADVVDVCGGGWLGRSSCCTASGAFGLGITGMSGQFVAKHLGCQDSPQLFVFLTLHSRPWKSRLQMEQVALVWGTRCGCIMV